MKKFLYVFIGIAIALGSVVLYSFKAKENAEVSYAIIEGIPIIESLNIHYSDGRIEDAISKLNIKMGSRLDKGQLPIANCMAKVLDYMKQQGYTLKSESKSSGQGNTNYIWHYTLIKQN